MSTPTGTHFQTLGYDVDEKARVLLVDPLAALEHSPRSISTTPRVLRNIGINIYSKLFVARSTSCQQNFIIVEYYNLCVTSLTDGIS